MVQAASASALIAVLQASANTEVMILFISIS
jgi:hypothetical protein